MSRIIRITLVVVVVMALVVFGGGGWYYSSQLLVQGTRGDVPRDAHVVAVDDTTITVDAGPSTDFPRQDVTGDLVVGFGHDRGYLRLVGAPISVDGAVATRNYEVVEGHPPSVGDRGSVDLRAFPEDPHAVDLTFEDVLMVTELGEFPGWVFTGSTHADHWVVFTHGRGGTRGDALRTVEHVVGELGYSVLVITMRNDVGAPESPDGHGHFGDTEWQDLEAWLAWLSVRRAPSQITLFGASQGGAVTAACMQRCEGIDDVTGMVLDSPLLSLPETLDMQAAARGIPGPMVAPLLGVTQVFTSLRGGPDFDDLDQVQAMADLDLPILVVHGTRDDTVPISPSRALAALDRDQVVLVEYDGDHVRGWNVDEQVYDQALTDFFATSR